MTAIIPDSSNHFNKTKLVSSGLEDCGGSVSRALLTGPWTHKNWSGSERKQSQPSVPQLTCAITGHIQNPGLDLKTGLDLNPGLNLNPGLDLNPGLTVLQLESLNISR